MPRALGAGLLLFFLSTFTTRVARAEPASETSAIGAAASDFALRDLSGHTVRLSDHLGKSVILIDFWATWCLPCQAELPHLQALYEQYAAQGFVVLAVSMDGPETLAQVGPTAQRLGLTFPVLLDEETQVVGVYNAKRLAPLALLIDRQGRIVRARAGYSSGDESLVTADVQALVAGARLTTLAAERPLELHIKKEALRIGITESMYGAYHGNFGPLITEQDKYGRDTGNPHFYDLVNRLNIDVGWRHFRLAARLDTAIYADQPPDACAPGGSAPIAVRSRYCQNPIYPEKLSLEYAGRDLSATLGDFYVSFGRGLVLSLRKLDELGIDTTLRGAKVQVRRGEGSATLIAGFTNIQNVDQATGRYAPDPNDFIAGGRAEYRFLERITVGVHEVGGVQSRNQSLAAVKQPDGYLMYGATVDAPRLLPQLALYLEAAGQMVQVSDQRQNGYALYGAATAYLGPVALLLEGKHYSHYQRWRPSVDGAFVEFAPVAYTQPPTAERLQTELVSPIYDVSGSRLRADWRLGRAVTLYASYAYFEDRGSPGGVLYYHDPYAGAEIRWNGGRSHLFPSGGYRIERCASGFLTCVQQTGGEFQHVGHIEWDAVQELPHRLSIETQGFVLFRQGDNVTAVAADGTTVRPDWTEGTAYLALKWTPHLVLAGGYEWTTRPSSAVNQHFVNGSLQWNITPATSVRLFAGGNRGGLRCISGVCRDFPPFTGARFELVLRI